MLYTGSGLLPRGPVGKVRRMLFGFIPLPGPDQVKPTMSEAERIAREAATVALAEHEALMRREGRRPPFRPA